MIASGATGQEAVSARMNPQEMLPGGSTASPTGSTAEHRKDSLNLIFGEDTCALDRIVLWGKMGA